MTLKILALGGDGIGPEVVDTALRVPDIAGQGIANPVSMILSLAMMLEYTADEVTCARKIEAAVNAALNTGHATRDIGGTLGTDAMADAVIAQFRDL